jgi:signal peptidase I
MPTEPPAQAPPASADRDAPAAGPATDDAPPAPRAHEGSIKETIESILIAFILAFIFRAFVVEAFVIPTGSMAPTLMGAHMRFACTDCGYRFDANYSSPQSGGGDDVVIPSSAAGNVYSAHCPNCGLQVPRLLRPDVAVDSPDAQPGDSDNDATAPPVHYGDRILVLKYVYEWLQPQRWDVVVFKTPDRPDPSRPQASPGESPYTINYIKRLIGRPRESIMILDGDVYARAEGSDQWVVQTKPRVAQEALWRLVYDNDFLPHRPEFVQPWRAADSASGWAVGTPQSRSRELTFDRPGRGTSWLTFAPDPEQANQPLKDWLAYADTKEQSGNWFDRSALIAQNNVSDLKLQLFYERQSGSGPLRLELSKIDDTFTAEIGPDHVRLLHRQGSAADREIAPPVPLAAGIGPVQVEFSNADYQVTVRIDGKDLIRTTPQQYAPDLGLLRKAFDDGSPLPMARVKIGAEAQACRLSHVSLWRDVYYTNRGYRIDFGTPANPITLGEKEYWVLGDNTLMSGDARGWQYPIVLPHERLMVDAARVPERFLLGKAFFVYWPAGFRAWSGGPGFVPNFGSMRFIH